MDHAVEIRKLNSLRGLAVLIVLISHYSNASDLWGKALGNGAGQFGVMIFFLLSAFLISYLYLHTPPTPQAIANFAIARVARVMPLFLIVVIISFAVKQFSLPLGTFAYNIKDVNSLLSHFFLLHGTSVLWTIPPEIHFYIFFALAWFFRPQLKGLLYVGIVLLIASSFFFIKDKAPTATLWGFTVTLEILKVLPYFAVGFLLGDLFRGWQPSSNLRRHYYVTVLILIPLLYPEIFFYLTGQQHGMWADVRVLGTISAVFFVLVFLVPENNPILENWLGDMLGKISYSLYLLHYPLLQLLKSMGLVTGLAGLALFLVLASVLAYISFSILEFPARQWIRKAFASRVLRNPASHQKVDARSIG